MMYAQKYFDLKHSIVLLEHVMMKGEEESEMFFDDLWFGVRSRKDGLMFLKILN